MPRVFLPAQLRPLADGQAVVSVDGQTVAQAIDALESRYPGIRERLCEGGSLKPSLTVAVDERVRSEGLRAKVAPESEVHFLPAIGGG